MFKPIICSYYFALKHFLFNYDLFIVQTHIVSVYSRHTRDAFILQWVNTN